MNETDVNTTNTTDSPVMVAAPDLANATPTPESTGTSDGLTMAQMLALLKKGRVSRRTGSRVPLDARKAKFRARRALEKASQKKNRGK